MANYVCPHCGSNRTEEENQYKKCLDCGMDFGRVENADNGETLEEAMTGLRFRYGDVVSGSVRLRIAEDGDACVFEVYDANEGGVDRFADVISKEEWAKFKQVLFGKLYLADWDKTYIPVNDGKKVSENNEWELGIDVGDDEIVYRGYDEFPPYWKGFMKLLDPYFACLNRE